MAVTDFIVAIELGSTRISGVAGKKKADGSIQILAYASEKSSGCIRKGTIFNLDKTTKTIETVIGKLEEKLDASIKKVYVGVGGQSVRSIRKQETKKLNEDTRISQALIDEMMKSNMELPLMDYEILAVEPQEYEIGTSQFTSEPVGVSTDRIKANFLNVIGRNKLKSDITKCFRQAGNGYEIAECVVSAQALAEVVLTPTEKRSGCILVDFGADTTTVSVYRGDKLRHLAVIPLGGSNITKDICSKQIYEGDAEQVKLTFGSAYTAPADNQDDANKELSLDGKVSIKARDLEEIVEARIREILENVVNQVVLSDYSEKLLEGAVLTGGGANLANMEEAFTRISNFKKVRTALQPNIALDDAENLIALDGTQNTLIGLLAIGKENCCKEYGLRQKNIELLTEMEQQRKKERERQEAEEAEEELKKKEKEKLEKCERLISAIRNLIKKKQYKNARKKADEALALGVQSKREEIDELIDEIENLRSENSIFKRFYKALSDSADDIMKE